MSSEIVGIALIVAVAFIAKVIHATIGMGFGIMMTFVFLFLGYDPTEVVTSILVAQTTGQILAAFFHQRFKNVNFSKGSRELKITLVIIVLSLIGAVIGPLIQVNVPKFYMRLFTSSVIVALGVFMLIKLKSSSSFSWSKLGVMGFSAGFLKGLTGCGYGPVLTAGQIIIGVEGKSAIGITMLSGPLMFLTSIITYMLANASINWYLSLYITIAVALATPLAAFFLKRIRSDQLKFMLSISTIIMGILITVRTFF